jgi:hypothetical protein
MTATIGAMARARVLTVGNNVRLALPFRVLASIA